MAASRPWLATGVTLSVTGSAMLLISNAWWLAVGLPHSAAWSSTPGLVVGGMGLAGALRTRSRPERAALVTAAIGLLALAVDFMGWSGPPRVIPGAMLLAGAAITAGSSRPTGGWLPPLATVTTAAGLVAHTLVGLFLLPLGLVAPAWSIIVLLTAWAALLALAVHHRRTRPLLFLAAPVATATLTAGMLYVGGTFLGWTP